jgi:MFS family permease
MPMPDVALGLKKNWKQFALLVVINAFVGGMVGLERTVVPLIGAEQFKIASSTLVVSFIVTFGVVKAFSNLLSGSLADRWGRKRVLVLGWLAGLPVPFMLILAPSWTWVVAANALLGVNQGLAWSMTVIMKIDLVGPRSRGLAVGVNEFAGYVAVGATAFLTGFLASRYGLRPVPFYLGIGYAVLGLALSALLVRDTRAHVALEMANRNGPVETRGFWSVFSLASYGNKTLFAASQAGLVNNLNDGMSWGLFPLFFASFGLGVERIGILKAIYPAAWGLLQLATGPLSDRLGRKGLIVGGMWVQARRRDRHGLPEPDRGRVGCLLSSVASAIAQRLPVLARSRLCGRGARCRTHCGSLRICLCHSRDCRTQFSLRPDRGNHDAREPVQRLGIVIFDKNFAGTR